MIYAAFCGTGKIYLSKKYSEFKEVECWKYQGNDFPENYISAIKEEYTKHRHVLVSANPIVLKGLHKEGFNISLIYPDITLKSEYLKRFEDMGSSPDFINTLSKNWGNWILELQDQNYCSHVVLKSKEYLENILIIIKNPKNPKNPNMKKEEVEQACDNYINQWWKNVEHRGAARLGFNAGVIWAKEYYEEAIAILSEQVPKGAVDFDKLRKQQIDFVDFKTAIENALLKLDL